MFAENLLALLADVEAHPAVGDIVHRSLARIGILGEFVGDQRIGREYQLHAALLGFLHDFECRGEHLRLAERVADFAALRRCEGVGHTAADDDRIDLLHQVFEDRDLGRNFRPADDRRERAPGVQHQTIDRLQFVLHHVAEHLVVGEFIGDQGCRGVCAVRGAESVVDVAVGIRGQPLDELFLRGFDRFFGCGLLLFRSIFGESAGLALLLGVETQVFEQHHLAGFEVPGCFGRFFSHAVAGENHGFAQQLFDRGDDLSERIFHIVVLLGPSQMRHQDYRAARVEYLADRGDRRPDAGVVRYLALVVEGDVEVHADNRPLAFEIVRIDFEHNSKYLMVERAGSTTGYNVTNLAK